jgi:hypothetical protein
MAIIDRHFDRHSARHGAGDKRWRQRKRHGKVD